uniref:Uncharacterized protein n=1 Tax=Anguilla anguilla TaxID=7936 RepID=A0A0E9W6S7_ANGAN
MPARIHGLRFGSDAWRGAPSRAAFCGYSRCSEGGCLTVPRLTHSPVFTFLSSVHASCVVINVDSDLL